MYYGFKLLATKCLNMIDIVFIKTVNTNTIPYTQTVIQMHKQTTKWIPYTQNLPNIVICLQRYIHVQCMLPYLTAHAHSIIH